MKKLMKEEKNLKKSIADDIRFALSGGYVKLHMKDKQENGKLIYQEIMKQFFKN